MNMSSVIILLTLLCVQIGFVVGAGGLARYAENWDYADMGPSVWNKNFTKCGHRKQSPVNILTEDVIYDEHLGNLELHNYEQMANVSFTMKNSLSAITFAAEAPTGNEIPQAVTFQGTKYRLYQFHFHWGSTSFQGSEHLLDSQQYAAEMHVIHYNDKYANVGEAADKEDGLLVWGHFLKVASGLKTHNLHFATLLSHFQKAEQCCEPTKLILNLKALLPDNSEEFYHYNGSLTTPPCHESVKWIVNRNPLLVSEKQMQYFRGLRTTAQGNRAFTKLSNNYRPVMPLHDRLVYANFNTGAINFSTGATLKPLTGLLVSFLLIWYAIM